MNNNLSLLKNQADQPVDLDISVLVDNLQTDLSLLGKFFPAGTRFGSAERDLMQLLAGYLESSAINLSDLGLTMNPFADVENVIGFLFMDGLGEELNSQYEARQVFFRIFDSVKTIFSYLAKHPSSKLTETDSNGYTPLIVDQLKKIATLLDLDLDNLLDSTTQS